MVTDDERREVARRLRDSWRPRWHGEKMMHRLREALGIDQHVSTFGKFRYYRAVAERIADLIEPIIPADPGEAGLASVDAFIREHTEKPVDRDALLKLADEMENDTWYLSDFDHRMATSFAHRIREALKGES